MVWHTLHGDPQLLLVVVFGQVHAGGQTEIYFILSAISILAKYS